MTDASRPASVSDMPEHERPLSEQWRIVSKEHVRLDAEADLLRELRDANLERMKLKLIDTDPKLSDAKAERLVKASAEWEVYIRGMVAAREKANLQKAKMKWIEIRIWEQNSEQANARNERRLNRGW